MAEAALRSRLPCAATAEAAVLRGGDELIAAVERAPLPDSFARQPALARLRDEALALVRHEGLLRAAACWRFAWLDAEPAADGRLRAEGHVLEAPWLLPSQGRLTGVACAVCTLGGALEARVGELFAERRRSLAVALDAVGNRLLAEWSRRVQDRIARQARSLGLTMAGELRAGDPGLPLQAQAAVLQLAGAFSIGVALTGTSMMNPGKSLSLVQGVGEGLAPATWSRCDPCPSRARCAMARGPHDVQAHAP